MIRYLIFIFFSLNSFSYTFTRDVNQGFYWGNFPIPLTILSSNATELGTLETALLDVIDEWSRYPEKIDKIWDYQLTVPGESARVENYIRWSDNFEQETGYNSQTTLAVTIRFSQIPLIRRTEIVLNRGHIFLKNNQFLRVVLLHEMGHTIGLDHSEYYEAIMYSNLKFEQPENQVLHEDDVNGLRASIDLNLNRQSQNVGIEALSGKNDESSNAFSCGTIDVNGSNGGGPLLPNFIALIFGLLLSFVLKYKRGRFV